MIVELLQRLGLNKYEAEAYAALVAYGPMTGYELGKRSQVPLSRSYEILERLTQKGLALMQPADPARYAAEEPEAFLARTRAAQAATLDALTVAFAALAPNPQGDDFWVVRGRGAILAHASALIAAARQRVDISAAHDGGLAGALEGARRRGCRVTEQRADDARLLLLIDDQRAFAGTLAPVDTCQAVTSTNLALVAAVSASFRTPALALTPAVAPPAGATGSSTPLDWLDWETRKQRRLLGPPGNEAA
jgi:sugar-specific transcriptional regulator TrmB